MKKLITLIDRINEVVGNGVSWLTSILVWVVCIDVLFRYVFDFSFIWINELEIYFFAFVFLLGAGYAFQQGKHVRVDMLYTNWSEKRKAWVNLVGAILLLIPWTTLIIWVGYKYALNSWNIGEASPQPGGLPALYILKFSIPVAFLFLLLQAVSSLLSSILTIQQVNS